jgi:hypothetical protein
VGDHALAGRQETGDNFRWVLLDPDVQVFGAERARGARYI